GRRPRSAGIRFVASRPDRVCAPGVCANVRVGARLPDAKPPGRAGEPREDAAMNRPFDLREVLFLIPAYNEEGNLGAVLDELHREFPAATLLVIDDGSADRTAAVARAHEAVVVTLPFNMG